MVVPTIGLVQRCRGRPPGRPGRIGCRGSFCLSSFAFGILEYGYRHIPKPVQIHRPPLRFLSEVGAGCRDGHCPSGRSRTPAPTNPIRGWCEIVGRGSEATRAAMNDSPVDCQNREWTEPQRDLAPAVMNSAPRRDQDLALRSLSGLDGNCRGRPPGRPGASDAVEVSAYRRLRSASSNMAIAIFLSLFKSIDRPYGFYPRSVRGVGTGNARPGGRGRPPLRILSEVGVGKFILYYFFFFLYSLPHFPPVNPAPKIPHKPHGYTLPKRGVRWKEHLVEKRRKPTQIKGLDGFFCGKDR